MSDLGGVQVVTSGGKPLVHVLAAAFADDPWLRWTLPDPGSVRVLMSMFLREVAFLHGVVLVTGDPVAGVAVMMPPGVEVPERPGVGEMVLSLHGRMAGLALDADAVIDRLRPADPGWVLHAIAVAPPAQRQGTGSRLLRGCLAHADGGVVTLETANPLVLPFYRREGFSVTTAVDLSAGPALGADAPTIWMLSHPGTAVGGDTS